MPNKILNLFKPEFSKIYLDKKLLPLFPEYKNIAEIKINPRKNNIIGNYYHVVIEFVVTFEKENGKKKKFSIFSSAHSQEPREKMFYNLNFLWSNDFGNRNFRLPKPLFYSKQFNATFYVGMPGHNLYYFIKQKKYPELMEQIPKAANWFFRLHSTSLQGYEFTNDEDCQIENVVPGTKFILQKIKDEYPELSDKYEKIYACLIEREKKYFAKSDKRYFVHGDAHPENIIIISKNTTGVIDYADFCLSDFARDVGTFMQQIYYMISKKGGDKDLANVAKNLFLESYLKCANIELDNGLKERINTYYNWTQMRTATFFIIKYDSQPERGIPLIDEVMENLNIN